MNGIEAVVGYAVGTIQVLLIDWWRRIAAHRRQLRLLQAELRRLRTFDRRFRWVDGYPPEDEKFPIPPRATELFAKTVGEIEWRLTDEHEDDNAQQATLQLLDAFEVLRFYADRVNETNEEARQSSEADKSRFRIRGQRSADAYDSRIDVVMYLVDAALSDISRRQVVASMPEQMNRAFCSLPTGTKPDPISGPEDPRIEKWRRSQLSGAS